MQHFPMDVEFGLRIRESTLRPCLHRSGSKRICTSMGIDWLFVYTGPAGFVPVRIHYPYQFRDRKVYPFGSAPVEVQCKRLDLIHTGTDMMEDNNLSHL